MAGVGVADVSNSEKKTVHLLRLSGIAQFFLGTQLQLKAPTILHHNKLIQELKESLELQTIRIHVGIGHAQR